ncbi:hypothetical protein TSUD_256340 [Trifolium subterraneum]|uniref:Legume lectin domain-containing protein n=1 Tax=Trifolium subterraneum TaxID=3900 RepID=A0A2Z6M7Q1_TRISU|nr:hypothetical protein TSUD_256340 [Trifolium subterraneum]
MNPFKSTLFTLFTTFILTAGNNIQLDFPYFTTTNTATNITFIGDSSLRNRVVSLTKSTTFSTGSIIYNKPISLFDISTNTTSSFSTTFSFSITNPNNPTSFGDGIAFFISPNNLSSSPSSSSSTTTTFGLPTNFVAVEFDTRFDPRFNDPNENHIGFNIDTLDSMKTVDPIYNGIDLKSGNTITSWIDYKTDVNSLSVFLSYSPIKPRDPILFVNVDLSEYFRGNNGVYVGFSASAEKSTELHQIESWSFYTVGFEPARPRLRSHNVSDNSVSVNTGNEILNNEAVPFTVPKVKPCLTFSSDLPLTIDEIVSDVDDGEGEEFNTSQSMCEIKIE